MSEGYPGFGLSRARHEAFTTFAQRAMAHRNGHPQDVAHAVTALIESGFITGVALPCDGGLQLTWVHRRWPVGGRHFVI
jgi:NAD(P)-dependent dehydrogenase (short-subunit alcohol dehydrogenase family)